MMGVFGRHNAKAEVLVESATVARKCGHLTQAAAALHMLKQLLLVPGVDAMCNAAGWVMCPSVDGNIIGRPSLKSLLRLYSSIKSICQAAQEGSRHDHV